MGNRETALKNIAKAQQSPKRGKHGKWSKTIAKEEMREVFEEVIREEWIKLMSIQLKDSKKNRIARHYTINQMIGKPMERQKVEAEIDFNIDDV